MIPLLMIFDFMPIPNYLKYQNNFHFATDSLCSIPHGIMPTHPCAVWLAVALCPLHSVIDVILHGLEHCPNDEVLLAMLRDNFVSSHIVAVLGLQFDAFNAADCKKEVPRSLYVLTVHLIHHGLFRVEDILGHLTPTLEAHRASRLEYEQREQQRARNVNHVNLNETDDQKGQREKDDIKLLVDEEKYHRSERQSQIYQLLQVLYSVIFDSGSFW